MRVAIVHYHLKPGGVTRVIANAVRALIDKGMELLVISGEAPESESELSGASIAVVPELSYRTDSTPDAAQDLYASLLNAAVDLWGTPPDIWHWHNHSLGKNVHAPDTIKLLASRSPARFLLQIHDFAEDGRPANFNRQRAVCADFYPQAKNVHYVILNHRDADILTSAGCEESRLHVLPNAISLPAREVELKRIERPAGFENLILYPTRAIRRKNLGEVCLHAMFAPKGFGFATTLLPRNPEWQAIHSRWQSFSKQQNLPVRFGVGEDLSIPFGSWISSAHSLITTSIAEGFGLAFLEPYLFEKSVCGRDLPDITRDFKDCGIDLHNLYSDCRVPLASVELRALETALRSSVKQSCESFGVSSDESLVQSALNSIANAQGIEFGRLDENLQMTALERIGSSAALRSSWQPKQLDTEVDPGRIAHNNRIIRESYSLPSYGRRLLSIYEELMASPMGSVEESLDPMDIVKRFLSPERYNLLRD